MSKKKPLTPKKLSVQQSMKQQVIGLSEEPKKYIAYGSNLNLKQMRFRCPTAKNVGKSEIPDYELVFRGSKTGSYLTIEPKEGGTVPVLIWEVQPKDELALDRYEGYPSFYGKENMTVILDGEPLKAMVYTMPTHHELGLPSQYYVDTVAEGYETAGFDLKILEDSIDNTYKKMCLVEQSQSKNFEKKQAENLSKQLGVDQLGQDEFSEQEEAEPSFQMRFDA